MPNETIGSLFWNAQFGLALGLGAVLLLRRPLRHLAGARLSYAVWGLPPLMALVALGPQAAVPVLILERVEWRSSLAVLPAAASGWPHALPALWVLGVLLILGLHALRHLRFMHGLPSDRTGLLRGPRGSSPGLVGLWRPRLLLPMDFEDRFSAQERQWVFQHEALHARRYDNAARLLAVLIQALAWFNPLVWWGFAALRQDQELACDATLLPRLDGQWRAYAAALLKAEAPHSFPATAAAWQAAHPIKERILMLKRPIASRGQRAAAKVLLLGAALLTAGLVQAVTSAPKASGVPPAPLTTKEACTTIARPELPAGNFSGEFKLLAVYRIGATGKPEQIKVDGDVRLADSVRQAISGYECRRKYAGSEVRQEFVFKFE